MDNRVDLNIFREILLSDEFKGIKSDLKRFDKANCHFYYDESNNIRKLWLRESGFNAPTYNDFVLGGVMCINQSSANVEVLKTQLNLQKSADEMKFKHICKSKDFLDCLLESKVKIFLQWLYQSDLYIHCSNTNNLYYAIIDIIDTIEDKSFIPYIFQIKNELYKIATTKYHEFYELLLSYNYPNIAANNIAEFYKNIINFIDDIGDSSFEIELLRQCLKQGQKQKELVFLQNNPEKTIIDNYFHFYLRSIGIFYNAQHTFDNEYQIENEFEKYELLFDSNKLENFEFVDSKDNPFVQVSDCIVGLLGKYYRFINSLNGNMANEVINLITPAQKITLKVFAQLIKKSENISKLLIQSTESIYEHDKSAIILNTALY